MRVTKSIIFATVLLLGVAVVTFEHTALAQTSEARRGVMSVGGGDAPSFDSGLKAIVNTLLFIIGAVSVIMIIYGGFRYVTSAGDTAAVSSAKNTILYAVIGLVVALTAWSIVTFVLDAFDGSGTGSDTTSDRDPRYNLSPDDPNYIGPTP